MKITQNIHIFKTKKFSFGIDNAWNHECDLFRGIDFKFGFFYIKILRSL